MTKKKENRGFSNFGFSTILLSFVMICVVTFSALALVTANSDYRLSKKVADKTAEYYTAQEKAYEWHLGIIQIAAALISEVDGAVREYLAVETRVKQNIG